MKWTLLWIITFYSFSFCQGQKLESPLLDELKEQIRKGKYPRIDGCIVKIDKGVIIEEYFHGFERDSLHDTRSSFKSITSLLTGIAIDKKLINLHDPLEKHLPEAKNREVGAITIQELLEMRSGLNCEEFYDIGPDCEGNMWDQEDWISYCLGLDIKEKPGINWAYTSIDPMLIGEVIARASGMSIMDFAKIYLFEPLDIHHYRWTVGPKGSGMTAGSFYMRPIDMLKIIELVSKMGEWNGKQVVSAEWIATSTDCHIDIDFLSPVLPICQMQNTQALNMVTIGTRSQ